MSVLLSVVTCTAWATWDGVIVNEANHRQAGDVVNVSCAVDKMFPDSERYKTTTCSPVGEWVPPVPDCVCKSKNTLCVCVCVCARARVYVYVCVYCVCARVCARVWGVSEYGNTYCHLMLCIIDAEL